MPLPLRHAVLLLGSSAIACAQPPDAKTLDDAASLACTLLAQRKADEAQKQGIAFEDVHRAVKAACDAKDEYQPWIDALTAVSREQDATVGTRMGVAKQP